MAIRTSPQAPKHLTIYDEIRMNGHIYTPARSAAWMERNIRTFALNKNIGPQRMLRDGLQPNWQSKLPTIGGLYFFLYDPRHKSKLEYWDSNPLIIPFSMTKKHFTGINLHFLHPKLRLIVLSKLETTMNNSRLNPEAKMRVNWQIIKSLVGHALVAPAVKMYLIGQVKSNFLKVEPQYWAQAVYLPLERFKKANNNQVWADSNKTIANKL